MTDSHAPFLDGRSFRDAPEEASHSEEPILPPAVEDEADAVILPLEDVPAADPDLAPTDDPAAQLHAALHDLKLERASFQTYRARVDKEKAEIRKYGGQELAGDLLRVLDYFEMSLTFDLPALDPQAQAVIEGVKYTVQELHRVLEQHGIEAINTGAGFDPSCMEVIGTEVAADVAPNTILSVATRGYRFRDRVLRPARVVLAAAPSAEEDAAPAAS